MREATMHDDNSMKTLVLLLRLAMAWVFLYAGLRQAWTPGFSIAGFLGGTKTFHDVFAWLAQPPLVAGLSVLIAYGHVLIGLSLLTGMFFRQAAWAGAILMLLYWLAHMDWPYIENRTNLIVDQHLIFIGVLLLLARLKAGAQWGLDRSAVARQEEARAL